MHLEPYLAVKYFRVDSRETVRTLRGQALTFNKAVNSIKRILSSDIMVKLNCLRLKYVI